MHEISQQYDYYIDGQWYGRLWRGKALGNSTLSEIGTFVWHYKANDTIYPEHDDKYLKECLLNLKSKGAELINGKTVDGWLIELELKGV